MDYLYIEGLRVETRIGVHDWEKKINQVLLIDIKIPRDFSKLDDALENTVDYDALCQHVTKLVESNPFNLIETVAHQIIASIQSTFKLQALTIRVSKPHAINNAKNIYIEINNS
ncbi:MAG: dihydroneopterin aldolase [Legionella sp.]|nr:dihydroneopterin aldolase [Legionella sp.]